MLTWLKCYLSGLWYMSNWHILMWLKKHYYYHGMDSTWTHAISAFNHPELGWEGTRTVYCKGSHVVKYWDILPAPIVMSRSVPVFTTQSDRRRIMIFSWNPRSSCVSVYSPAKFSPFVDGNTEAIYGSFNQISLTHEVHYVDMWPKTIPLMTKNV